MTLTVTAVVAMTTGRTAVEAAWTLTLANETGRTLTFYEVNASPPPSRLSAGTVSSGATFNIDPAGFNPVFAWDGGISLTGTDPNGFYIGLALADTPPLMQYKLFHYKVTPGTAGSDPGLQPILLDEQVVEVTEGEVVITVDGMWNVTIGPPTVGVCCTLAGCIEVMSSAACTSGTYLSGATCTPKLCTSASGTIGSGGGTIEAPDGSVSVEFPPDCLSTSTTITIEEGDYPARLYDIELTGKPEADFDVHVAYTFAPDNLEFCPEAKLCVTFDRAGLGLDATDCADLRFFHRDKICGFDWDSTCSTDMDCPAGVTCHYVYHTDEVTCTCPATSSSGTCCASISHFSDYIMVSPAEEEPCCPGLIRWCCGIGVVFVWPLMLVVLGLAKARGAGCPRS